MNIVIRRIYEYSLERRLTVLAASILTPIIIGNIAIWISSGDPLIFIYSFTWSLLDPGLLRYFIPLTLCGLGLLIPYRAGIWNIGAEGQFIAGAILSTFIALYIIDPALPRIMAIPLILLAGGVAGSIIGLIPAILKTELNVNEVLATLMLNYIMIGIGNYLVYGPWRGVEEYGYPRTDLFPRNTWIMDIDFFGYKVNIFMTSLTILIGILLYIYLRYSRFGFELTVAGLNPRAATYSGINLKAIIWRSMAISGWLAGLAGSAEVLSVHHQLIRVDAVSAGYGYIAIIVAWISGLHPIYAIIGGYFIGGLLDVSHTLQIFIGIPYGVTNLYVGLLLLFIAGLEFLKKYRVEIRVD